MMFLSRSRSRTLVSFVLLFLTLVTPSSAFYAVFYNSTLKNQLKQEFLDVTPLNENDKSFTVGAYDHTTIAFDPNQTMMAYYNTLLGNIQTAHILAYAHDEHGQAILLNYDGPDAIQTVNAFPHTTIATSDQTGIYSAVYSNDLWARIAASGFVNISIDPTGHPASISFAPSVSPTNNTIVANLSEFVSGTNQYAATQVAIHIFEPTIGGLIQGTFCEDTRWNETTGFCNTTITDVPTTPSSSGETSNSTAPSSPTATATPTPTPTSTPDASSASPSSNSSSSSNSSLSSSSSSSSVSSNSTSDASSTPTPVINSSSGSNFTSGSGSSGGSGSTNITIDSSSAATGNGTSGTGTGTGTETPNTGSSGGGSSIPSGNNTMISSSGSKNNTVSSTGTNTNITTPTTTAPTTSTGPSSSTGILAAAATPSDTLSTAAQVGIGIGVGVGAVILVITVGVLLLYCVNRRDHVRTTSKMNVEMHPV